MKMAIRTAIVSRPCGRRHGRGPRGEKAGGEAGQGISRGLVCSLSVICLLQEEIVRAALADCDEMVRIIIRNVNLQNRTDRSRYGQKKGEKFKFWLF